MNLKSRILCAAVVVCGLALPAGPAYAASGADVWASGATANWNVAGNWTSGSINKPPISGDWLVFDATTGTTTLTNDLTSSSFNVAGITFSNGAPAYTVNGTNTFVLTGNITNNSANLQTINSPFSVTTGRTITGAGDVALGSVISGAGSLTKAGNGTLTLSGSSSYTGNTVLDQGTLRYTADNTGMKGLVFGASAGSANTGTLDLSDASLTVTGLTNQVNSATANVITIGGGRTLTVNGNVNIGVVPTGSWRTMLTMTGGGELSVISSGGKFQVGGSTSGTLTPETGTLDLKGLSAVTIDLGSTGVVRINNPTTSNASANQSTLLLPTVGAATITAGNFNIGDGSGFNSVATQINTVALGGGLTTLNVDTNNIGTGIRDIGQISFAGSGGSLVIRAADGSGRAVFNLATGGATTGTTGANDLVDFTGHNADLLISTLNIGNQARNGNLAADFKFDTGTLDATGVTIGFDTTIQNATATPILTYNLTIGGGLVTIGANGVAMGSVTDTSTGSRTVNGNLNISGGTVTIGSTGTYSVRLGNNTSASGVVQANDTLNITGGLVTVAGDIIKGTTTRTTATLTLAGGTLDMGGHNISSSGTLINTFIYSDGLLKDLGTDYGTITLAGSGVREFHQAANAGTISGVVAGDGVGLTKTGGNVLMLSGASANTYNGLTTVNAGELHLNKTAGVRAIGGDLAINSGTVKFMASRQVTNGAAITVAGGVLDTTVSGYTNAVSSFNINAGSLAGAGTITAVAYYLGGGTVSANLGTGVATVTNGTTVLNGTMAALTVNITSGMLTLGPSDNRLSTNAVVTIGSGTASGKLRLGNDATACSQAIAGLWTSGSGTSNAVVAGGATGFSTLTINIAAGSCEYDGQLGGSAGNEINLALVKTGSGILLLGANNSFAGSTVVDAGNLWGAGSVSNSTVMVKGGAVIGPLTRNTPGTFAAQAVILEANARVAVVASSPTPPLSVIGELRSATTNFVDVLNFVPTKGTYPLISYGLLTGDGVGGFALMPLPGGVQGYLTNNIAGKSIDLVVTGTAAGTTWKGNVNNKWDIETTTNWVWTVDGTTTSVYYDANAAYFDNTAAAGAYTVNVATVVSPTMVTVSNDAAHNYLFTNSAIAGGALLYKAGSGQLTLAANNAYSGATVINGGVLQIGNNTAAGSFGTGPVTNNAQLKFNRSNAQTVANVIKGSGGLVKIAANTLTVTNANTYSGSTVISNGVLNIRHNTALGTAAGATTVANGAALQLQNSITVTGETLTLSGQGVSTDGALRSISGTNNWTGNLIIGTNVTRLASDAGLLAIGGSIDNGGFSTYLQGNGKGIISGIISGAGALTRSGIGTGTWTLTGANTYSGSNTVAGGTLEIGPGGVISNAAAITVGGTGGATLTVAGGFVYNSANDSSAVTIGDVIDQPGAFVMSGGTLTLSGAAGLVIGNSAPATWIQSGGVVSVESTPPLYIANQTNSAGTVVTFSGGSFTKTTGSLVLGTRDTAVMTITNAAQVTVQTFQIGHSSGISCGHVVNLDGGSLGVSSYTLAKGTGTNNFNGGTLVANADFTLPGNINTVVKAGGAVIDTRDNTLTIPGVLKNGGGSGGLTKFGSGTLVLTGDSTYTGGTTVSNGNLCGTGSISNSAVTVKAEAAIGPLNPDTPGTLTVQSVTLERNARVSVTAIAATPTLRVTGALQTTTTNFVDVVSYVEAAGIYTLISYGSLAGDGVAAFKLMPMPGGALGYVTNNTMNSSIDLVVTTPADNGGRIKWKGQTSSDWDIGITTNWTWEIAKNNTASYSDGDDVRFDDTAMIFTVNVVSTVSPSAVTVSNSVDYMFTNNAIGGGVALTKQGPGTLILAANNTYSGGTLIEDGVLQIGNNTLTGRLGTGPVTNNASLVYNRNYAATVANTISGTGGFSKLGGNSLTLGGTNTFSGDTIINGGTLIAAVLADRGLASNIGAGGLITIGSGAALQYSGSGASIDREINLTGGTGIINVTNVTSTLTISGSITNSGALTKTGTGTLTLSGANTYSGTTTVNAGTLKLKGTAFSTTARTYSISSGAVLNLDGGVSLPASATIIDGAGTLRVTGGSLAKTSSSQGSITFLLDSGSIIDVQSGATMRNGGWAPFVWTNNKADLNVDGSFDIWDGNAVIVDALTGSGSIIKGQTATVVSLTVGINNDSGTFNGTIGGTISFTKTGSGTQTLNKNNSYLGNTILDGGVLAYTANNTGVKQLIFGPSAGDTTTSMLDMSTASVTATGMTNQVNSATANTITIGSGKALTINGDVTIGPNLVGTSTTLLTMTGGGSFVVNNSGGNLQVGGATGFNGGNANGATLDLSGLGTFSANVSNFRVGDYQAESSGVNASSMMILANTSTIAANFLGIGDATGGTPVQSLKLGSGANVIKANTITVGAAGARAGGLLNFNTGAGTVKIRAQNGASAADLSISKLTWNASCSTANTVDFRGHTADVLLGTLTIADYAKSAGGTSSTTAGAFYFDTGTLTVNNSIVLARRTDGAASTTGTLVVGGGVVSLGSLQMAGSPAGGTAVATANFSNCAVTFSGSISHIGGGATSATVTMDNCAMDMSGDNSIGSAASPIALQLNSGTLKGVWMINGGTGAVVNNLDWISYESESDAAWGNAISGPGALIKAGPAQLELTGSCSYTGSTIVTNGTLLISSPGAITTSTNIQISAGAAMSLQRTGNGSLSDQAIIHIGSGGSMYLGSGVVETVKQLFLDGVGTMAGTWGSSSSSATHKNDIFFDPSGTGVLVVTERTLPDMGTIILLR